MSTTDQPFDYAAEFGTSYHSARRLPARAEQWISSVRAEKLQKYVQPTDRVLEYGVGFGWNLAALKCSEKVGFDVTPGLRSEVEAKGIQFEDRISDLASEYYDVIVAHHVLEHLRNPAASLNLFRQCLRPAGKLLVFVPFERERKYLAYRPAERAHHLYSWTPQSISNLLAAVNWRVTHVQIDRFRFDRFAALIADRFRAGEKAYRTVRWLAMTFFPEYEVRATATPMRK